MTFSLSPISAYPSPVRGSTSQQLGATQACVHSGASFPETGAESSPASRQQLVLSTTIVALILLQKNPLLFISSLIARTFHGLCQVSAAGSRVFSRILTSGYVGECDLREGKIALLGHLLACLPLISFLPNTICSTYYVVSETGCEKAGHLSCMAHGEKTDSAPEEALPDHL